jgi:hypothetical protein
LVRALLIGWSVPITHAKGMPLVELGRIRELLETEGDYASTKNGGLRDKLSRREQTIGSTYES